MKGKSKSIKIEIKIHIDLLNELIDERKERGI